MEERNQTTSIFKSHDPEKLKIYKAASLQNEIRFYLNDTQYLTAVEHDECITIKLGDETTNTKNTFSKNKKNLKLFFVIFGITSIYFIGTVYLELLIHNALAYPIILTILSFIIQISIVTISEFMEVTPEIKSKHSAEHMMVNFLEANKRLPKSIEEVKSSSRFSPNCGSRERINEFVEKFIHGIIASIFADIFIVIIVVLHFSSNPITIGLAFLSLYFIFKFIVGKVMKKYNALNFIIKPIKKVLTNIIQCANTTSKVKNEDIILAYFAAKAWLHIVYPKFYNEEEDIFWKKYLIKVNN